MQQRIRMPVADLNGAAPNVWETILKNENLQLQPRLDYCLQQ